MFTTAPVDGLDLYYQDTGDGSAIVFLHGFSGNHLSWWQQIPAFADDYRCIAPDQRMFGRSADSTNLGASALVDDLVAVLDNCSIERTAIVGHSMSGWVATSFVTQYPDRVAAVVLSGTPGGLIPPERHMALQLDETELAQTDPLSEELTFLADSISELNTDAPPEFQAIRPTLDAFPIDAPTVADCPVFLIAGEADPFMSPPVMREVSERLDGAAYTLVEGAGHSVNFEQPSVFNTEVKNFLANAAEY